MSLPPQVIQVKRKRTEEGPVPSFLRIEHTTKRHRSDAFLYRRHDPVAASAQAAKAAADNAELASRTSRPPTIQASKPGDEKRKQRGETAKDEPAAAATPLATVNESVSDAVVTTPKPTAAAPAVGVPATAEPRRFHLSRDSLMAAHSGAASVLGVAGMAGVRKRARYGANGQMPAEPAVFVERSKRQKRGDAIRKRRRDRDGKSAAAPRAGGSGGVPKTVIADEVVLPSSSTPTAATPLPKRPGWRGPAKKPASGTSTGGASTPTVAAADETTTAASDDAGADADVADVTDTQGKTPALPLSLSNRQWDTDMDQLAREMNDYTLEIIGRNLAQMEQEARAADAKRKADRQRGEMSKLAAERRRAAYAKYKPKPGLRYAERRALAHDGEGEATGSDEAAAASDLSDDEGEEDGDDNNDASETDDDDYVTETYVRIPGHEAAKAQAGGAALPGSVGLLVFDNEPDLEFFYGVEEDSEEEFEDDEDENAENHYTHDYPEDEVSSDDEFDRDPYHYRTGNASDLEAFVESDADDDDGEGRRGKGDDGSAHPPNVRLTKPGDL